MTSQYFCKDCNEYFWLDSDYHSSEIRHDKCGAFIAPGDDEAGDDVYVDESEDLLVGAEDLDESSLPDVGLVESDADEEEEGELEFSSTVAVRAPAKSVARKPLMEKVNVQKAAPKKVAAKKVVTKTKKKVVAKKVKAKKSSSKAKKTAVKAKSRVKTKKGKAVKAKVKKTVRAASRKKGPAGKKKRR